jgi:hypothetical protein
MTHVPLYKFNNLKFEMKINIIYLNKLSVEILF